MSTINNTSKDDNKDCDNNDNEVWLPGRLTDAIFIDLMASNDKDDRYLSQIEDKFDWLRLKFTDTSYEIHYSDLKEETQKHLEDYVKDCKTTEEKYKKLNGIMPDVIARVSKQVEHRMVANKMSKDPVLLQVSFYSMRENVSNNWKFIE
jgi:hypothetical protein